MVINREFEFKEITRYFHSYKILNLHNDLLNYKNDMIEHFNNNPPLPPTQNVIFGNTEFYTKYNSLFTTIIKKYYVVDETWMSGATSIYVQDNKKGEDDDKSFHTHIEDSSITVVTYIDPPNINEGGGLEVFDPDYSFMKVQPQQDYVYVFPSWMIHRPLVQSSNITRISLNWGYRCSLKPVHKLTGIVW